MPKLHVVRVSLILFLKYFSGVFFFLFFLGGGGGGGVGICIEEECGIQ